MLFLAKNLHASRVNLLMNDFAAGLPSPLAFLGIGEAIGRAVGAPHWGVGVLPILHRVDVSEGRTRPENSTRRNSNHFAPDEIAEDLTGSVTASLLFDVPNCSDEHQVAAALLGRRISGGPVHNTEIKVEQPTADGSAFNTVSRGYAMVRAEPAKSSVVATGGMDDLKALATELYPAERELGSGWFVPVAVGHRLLENPDDAPHRKGTRDPSIPHVFTEPAVGIAELVSVRNRRLTRLNKGDFADHFWRWKAEGTWIVGHPNYHPDVQAAVSQENIHGQS